MGSSFTSLVKNVHRILRAQVLKAHAKMELSKEKIAVGIVCFSHVFAVLLFVRGFFPTNRLAFDGDGIEDSSHVDQSPTEPFDCPLAGNRTSDSEVYSPIVGRTVVLVIDALRADFVFGHDKHVENIQYLEGLLRSRRAINLIAKVHSPTVTLPRIKAMTSGTIPGFIDVAMNFGASEYLEDNVIQQAFRNGHRIVFYGDDTWMKLFPHQFLRSEGTTSFFVNDFQEVDDNVTRHLEFEMRQDDWSVLVLHYLGLDHIGHVFGPQSELVGPKLRQMDRVVQLLDVALKKWVLEVNAKPSLLMICGDHGMNDAGGHGGSSHAETTVPLIFISSAFQGAGDGRVLDEVRQIDIAPVLSALLGLPIPKNNLGKLSPWPFTALNWRRRLYLAHVGVTQLQEVTRRLFTPSTVDGGKRVAQCFQEFQAANRNHCAWLNSEDMSSEEIAALYNDAAACFSDFLASSVTGYDDFSLLLAVVLHWLTLVYVARIVTFGHDFYILGGIRKFLAILAAFFISICVIRVEIDVFSVVSVALIMLFMSEFVVTIAVVKRQWAAVFVSTMIKRTSCEFRLLIGGCVLHALSFASTSFIEEEHQTWYFFCVTFFLAIALEREKSSKKPERFTLNREAVWMLAVAVVLRAARSLNSTGDKWAHLNDVGDFLNLPENKFWLSGAVIVGLVATLGVRIEHHRRPIVALQVATFFTTYLYHAAGGTLLQPFEVFESRWMALWLARFNYGLVFVMVGLAVVTSRDTCERFESVGTGWIAVCALLLRPHNIPLLAFWTATNKLLSLRRCETPAIIYSWLAQASFFQQGNSNSLARIDLTSGYVGLRSYDPLLVGTLLIIATYAGPVFWLLSFSATVHKRKFDDGPRRFAILLFCRSLSWCFYTVVVYTQRYHLFVWTVFSPKLLYEGMLSLVYVTLVLFTLVVIYK